MKSAKVWARIIASRLGDEQRDEFIKFLADANPTYLVVNTNLFIDELQLASASPTEWEPLWEDPVFREGYAAGHAAMSECAKTEYSRGFDYGRDWVLDEMEQMGENDPGISVAELQEQLMKEIQRR